MQLQKVTFPKITDSILSEVVKKIVDNFCPQKIIMFGSLVWGIPQEWSDIDILVILDSDESTSKLAAKISLLAKPQYIPMDILVRTSEEIEQRVKIGDHFIKKVLVEGRVLYER